MPTKVPETRTRDRAIAAFRKTYPQHEHNVRTYKVRSKKLIKVYGSTLSETICAVWQYKQNGLLRKISAGAV